MAHKSKSRGAPPAQAPLPQRIARARNEGRYQQALELTRQLFKEQPTDANRDLLRQVIFERGQQLESQKHLKEAATVYGNAADLGGPPEFQQKLVERLAACGDPARALTLAQKLGDPQLMIRIQGHKIDAAIRNGPASRTTLSTDLHPQFDAVLQAFQHAEAGQDEQARAALQTIGLQSPFLEWRVFLRGLIAFYANDDQRAIENWQRLDPQRLPARLAAPLRYGIDPAFRAAQPQTAQNFLRQQYDRWQGSGLLPGLRALQVQLSHDDKQAAAFRQVETLLPALRQEAPNLVPRLAAVCRWAIVQGGGPDNLDRYLRIFGAPADDPHLHRLNALALERRGLLVEAHRAWHDYEKEVAHNPAIWPGDQARHVRALVLTHMGTLAMEFQEEPFDLFPFGPRPSRKPKSPFKPSAEECYRRSLELAPEVLTTHEALMAYFVVNGDPKKALQAGKKLLEHFPDHAPSLQRMGSLALEQENLEEAQEYLERALRHNPLDQKLRLLLIHVYVSRARRLALDKEFDQARAEVQRALTMYDHPSKYMVISLAAAIELKAKDQTRYQALVAQAESIARHRLLVAYCLMCESIRLKMTPAQKKEFATEVQTALAQPPDTEILARLVGLAMLLRDGPKYHGQKTHEKKLIAAIEKRPWKDYDEESLMRLTVALAELDAKKQFLHACAEGRKRFPNNPRFYLAEAKQALANPTYNVRPWEISNDLKTARSLIEAMPRGEEQLRLMEELQGLEDRQREFAGPLSFFGQIMDDMFGFEEDDDDYDDD